jgi:hypothetical protein
VIAPSPFASVPDTSCTVTVTPLCSASILRASSLGLRSGELTVVLADQVGLGHGVSLTGPAIPLPFCYGKQKKDLRQFATSPLPAPLTSSSPTRTRTWNKPVTPAPAFPRGVDYLFTPEGCGALVGGLLVRAPHHLSLCTFPATLGPFAGLGSGLPPPEVLRVP